MDFYKKLKAYKGSEGLNWGDFGEVLGMSYNSFRMAVKRESLKPLQIKELERVFFNEKSEFSEDEKRVLQEIKFTYDNIAPKNIVRYLVTNHDSLMKNPIYYNYIQSIGKDIALEILASKLKGQAR
jgi:uncharacterized protein (UPF0335 family)